MGRGCLAGPVVVAAYVHTKETELFPHVNDSKKVSAKRRYLLSKKLCTCDYVVGSAEPEEIDTLNIVGAIRLAIERAITSLDESIVNSAKILIDGNMHRPFSFRHTSITQGDAKHYSIAAASIIAKVHRDTIMHTYAKKFPQYGFDKHVGYATLMHRTALEKFGACKIHRKSFKTVRELV